MALEDSSPQQIFIDTVEAIQNMEDETRKATLGSQVFGEEGVRQVAGITLAYEDLSDAVDAVEPAFDDQDVKSALDMQKATADLSRSMTELGVALRPLIDLTAGVFQDLADMGSSIALAFEGDFSGNFDDQIRAVGKSIEAEQKAAEDAAETHEKDLAESYKKVTSEAAKFQNVVKKSTRELEEADTDFQAMTTALDKVGDAYGDALQAQADYRSGFSTFIEGVKATAGSLDLATEAGRQNLQNTTQLREAIQVGLAQALKGAEGSYDSVRNRAENYRQELKKQLTQAGLTTAEIEEYQHILGLTPEDVETAIKLSGDEDAKIRLGLLQTAITSLPEDTQLKINTQIAMGDYQGAMRTVQAYMNVNPLEWKVKFDFPKGRPALGGGGTSGGPHMVGASSTYVTVNMPRGTRPTDVVRVLNQHARRNGRHR